MNREHSAAGYKVVTGTDATAVNFYGFSVVAEAVINAVIAPTQPNQDDRITYSSDVAGLAGLTLPVGYYPIRGSSMDLTSGTVILWKE